MRWPKTLEDEGRLSEVRQLYCEVLANQLLKINNIRKNGPGDLASLHKSVVVQSLVAGRWPKPSQVAWRMLEIGLDQPRTDALPGIKELAEVEYPLGNEMCRDGNSVRFTFPGLEDEPAEKPVRQMEKEIVDIAGSVPQISLIPPVLSWQGIAVEASERTRLG